ncbi:hypothetical protein ACRAWG_29855 [Methylobacterium sp. P31]
MSRDLAQRIAQARQRGGPALHAGVVQDQHIGAPGAALAVVGRGGDAAGQGAVRIETHRNPRSCAIRS